MAYPIRDRSLCGRRSSAALSPEGLPEGSKGPAGGLRCKAPLALVVVTCETWRYQKPKAEGAALQSHLVRAIAPYARCHRACVVLTPSTGMLSCRCSSPKSRSRLRPHPKLKRPGPLAPGLRPDMPANSPHRPEWTHLQAPAAPTLTREGRCSACHGVPTSICQGEVQVCRGCLAVLWHLDRRPAATPKHRPPAEPLPKPRAPDAELVEAQGAAAPPSSSEPPPGNSLEQVAPGGQQLQFPDVAIQP